MSESLPRPPHGASAAAVLQRGGPEGGAHWRGAAGSLGLVELLLLEVLQRSDRVALTEARLQLLPQEAHSHLQDVGFLQLGVGLLLVELLLQDDLELLDAAVDAISAHFLHDRFSQLGKRRQACKLRIQIINN